MASVPENNNYSIIIPTYHERDNISPLIERIADAMAGRDYEIVIVDDNSRDGTYDIVKKLSSSYPVRIIVRENERGLGSAVVHGIKNTQGKRVVVMDADLQHPPEVLPSLVGKIEGGADIAVGSRYVPGGGCEGWSRTRKIISAGAGAIAHIFLPSTRNIKDPMSGFFAFRRDIVDPEKLNPIGYKILLEILMEAKSRNVAEVPFTFVSRSAGESKLNARQQIDYLKHIFDLMKRKGELLRFIRFCLVGASGVGVNIGVFALLTRLGGMNESDFLALAIAIEISIITNFTLNDFFTFRDRRSSGCFLLRLLKFNVICLAGAGIQTGVYALLYHGLGIYDLLSDFIGIIVAMIWNYLLNTWITWH
ncbi:MAG: glycosyltransferase family 2 protein [Dehalococcoidales bacterium]|nr:glycosyltransferase family 2 protein [Dehalococcoidales bacterium]